MTHRGTLPIETERLRLRRFTAEDAEAVFYNIESDPDVTRYLRFEPHKSLDEAREAITALADSYGNPSLYCWAIILKETGECIGSVGAAWQNERIGMIHTYYCIGKMWWGGGIVTEAYKAVIRYFFEEVGANRIEAYHDPRNPASGRVMQKCGLKYEGTLRGADYNNTGIVDAAVYGILREDYPKQ